MMGRLNHDQEQLLYSFHLDEAVPHDHPVRKIAAVLDLSWVHSDLAPFYPKMGRPSIDPELMIRMLIEPRLPLVLWALDRGQDPRSLGVFTCPS
jgi:hypothetical protein